MQRSVLRTDEELKTLSRKRKAKRNANTDDTEFHIERPADSHLLNVLCVYCDFKLPGCSVVPHLHVKMFQENQHVSSTPRKHT
jgi:hypothetical protein